VHPNPTNKLVGTHSAPFWCWDKPRATLDSLDSPRPELGGSHHLPPYSILCSCLPHLHPNGSFSHDSQSGVPKLSRFGLPGLWTLITPRPKLGSGWGLNQSCSPLQELFNSVLHFMTRSQVTGWNPLGGFTKSSCGKLNLVARSRLPTLERGRGLSWEPRD